jgi:hypothetical protein
VTVDAFAGLSIEAVMQLRTPKWHPKRWNFRSCGTAPTPLEDAQGMQQTGIMLIDGGLWHILPELRCREI